MHFYYPPLFSIQQLFICLCFFALTNFFYAFPLFQKTTNTGCVSTDDENIILNPQFEDGLNNWTGRGCKITLHDSMADGKILPKSGKFFASATERTQSWNGIQQEITGRVQRKFAYEVTALVRIFGNNVTTSDVRATLYIQKPDFREQYIGIAKLVSLAISFL
jgi:hypothetical protein